jgi:hypothetical protein
MAAGGQQSAPAMQASTLARCLSCVQGALWSSGVACMLAAAFIFSVSILLVKLTAGRVPVLEITLVRSTISCAVSLGAV